MGHVVLSFVCVPQVKSGVEMPWDEQGAWRTDIYLSTGVLGLAVLFLLAITSLPSVGSLLTWREFVFIQVSSANPSKHTAQEKSTKDFKVI